jgi:hypothetical protein
VTPANEDDDLGQDEHAADEFDHRADGAVEPVGEATEASRRHGRRKAREHVPIHHQFLIFLRSSRPERSGEPGSMPEPFQNGSRVSLRSPGMTR